MIDLQSTTAQQSAAEKYTTAMIESPLFPEGV